MSSFTSTNSSPFNHVPNTNVKEVDLSWSSYTTFYLCGLGLLGNCLVAIVLCNRSRIKPDVNYRLMLAKSFGNILFFVLMASAVYPYIKFEFFASKLLAGYLLVVAYFLLDFFSIFRLTTHIVLSIRLNAQISTRSVHERSQSHCYYNLPARYLVLAIVFFSLAFYIQRPFGFTIAYSDIGDGYTIARSKWGQTNAYEIILFFEILLEDFLTLVVLTALTVRLIYVFRRTFRSNQHQESNQQESFSTASYAFDDDSTVEANSKTTTVQTTSKKKKKSSSLNKS